MTQFYEYDISVNLREGLHTRPVTQLVNLFQSYNGEITVGKYRGEEIHEYVDAKSPMELILLEATAGSRLNFRIKPAEGFDIEKLKTDISYILSRPN
jgi:phosphotransferase system HPr (HPr) family protein